MGKIFDGYLLVSDMDGTLLNSKSQLSQESIQAIDYFVENGGTFTIATGRTLESAGVFIPKLKVGLPVILYNGTKVYDYSKKAVVREGYLEEERKELIKKIEEVAPHLGIEVFSEEKDYIIRSCKYTERLATANLEVIRDVTKDLWSKNWTKILILGDEDELDELERNFTDICTEAIPIRSAENFLEVVPNYTSKGIALKKLIEDFNIDPEKVIAVGDNMNDRELLQAAKYGFCMGNGTKRLLEEAKYIAPANDDNAIEYIVKWLEEKIRTNSIIEF